MVAWLPFVWHVAPFESSKSSSWRVPTTILFVSPIRSKFWIREASCRQELKDVTATVMSLCSLTGSHGYLLLLWSLFDLFLHLLDTTFCFSFWSLVASGRWGWKTCQIDVSPEKAWLHHCTELNHGEIWRKKAMLYLFILILFVWSCLTHSRNIGQACAIT